MIALAVICLVVVALVVIGVAVEGFSDPLTFSTFAGDLTTQPFWVFVLGAATMLLALLALSLLRIGTRRKVAQRREIKRLRKVEEQSGTSTGDAGRGSQDIQRDDRGHGDADRTLVRERTTERPERSERPERNEQVQAVDLTLTERIPEASVPVAPPVAAPVADDDARHRSS